jgi:hypothetical protein
MLLRRVDRFARFCFDSGKLHNVDMLFLLVVVVVLFSDAMSESRCFDDGVLLVVSKSKRKDSDIVGELHPFEVK